MAGLISAKLMYTSIMLFSWYTLTRAKDAALQILLVSVFSYFSVSDLDGKLYDAYVAYPPPCAVGYSKAVETFAIDTLPEVLEKACGYKLFIASRDCLPGQGKSRTVAEQVV